MIFKFVQNGNLQQVRDNGVRDSYVYAFGKQYIKDYQEISTRYDCKIPKSRDNWSIQTHYATTFSLELIFEKHKFAHEIPF